VVFQALLLWWSGVKFVLGNMVPFIIHAYVWLRLVRRARLPRPWHIGITILFVVMFVSLPITMWSRRAWVEFADTVGFVTMVWLAVVGLTFVVLVVFDVAALVVWLSRRAIKRPAPEASLSRRVFLARVTGGAAMAISSTSVARGMISARSAHEIVDVEVKLAKLPKALDGFSIVQLSDLHVGMTIDREFVQRVVDQTNALNPDLVVLTGDLVDGKVADLRDEAAPLGNLKSKHGTYAVTGNHEYYSDADPWLAALGAMGITYLRNSRVSIGEGAASFDLAGVDDHSASRYNGHGEDLQAALGGRDASRAVVLLAHQPRQVRRAAKFGVDLQLSGHTHGGQIWPWHYLVKLQQGGLLAGRYQFDDTQLYVTRGCGYWGPPVRLLAPLEITRVILRAA
jgi:predicted MPP superfamily phosphohydrolase